MKSYRIRRIVSLAIICVYSLSIFGAIPAQAGIAIGLTFNSATACSTGVVIDYGYTGVQPTFSVTIWDQTLTNVLATATITARNGSSTVVKFTLSAAQPVGSSVAVSFNDGSGASYVYPLVSSSCQTASSGSAHTGPQPCFTDGRLDPFDCAAPVALYVTDESEGWMLQAWRIDDSDGTGHFLYTLFEENVPESGDNPILLHAENSIRLYLLPTGEFEVIAPYPKEPSKFYVFIFTLPDGEGYRADFGTGTGR